MKSCVLLLGLLSCSAFSALAEPRHIQVFVALCDNDSQGIAPVPAAIGDGSKPAANLYWGCSDGLASYFKRSKKWKLLKTEKDVDHNVMVQLEFKHVSADLTLTARAYRGTSIRACFEHYEAALAKGEADLVAYLGHNALMDFVPGKPGAGSRKKPAAIVLCCKSQSYFEDRIRTLGGEPILLTDQLMYPGSFLLHDAVEAWRQGKSLAEIRAAAGRAYARNQKISVRAATGVFSKIPTPATASEKKK